MNDVGDTWCSSSSSLRCVFSTSFFTSLNRSLSAVGFCPTLASVGACDCKSTPGAVQVSGRSPLTVTRQSARFRATISIFNASLGAWWRMEGCRPMRRARMTRQDAPPHALCQWSAELWAWKTEDAARARADSLKIKWEEELLPEKRMVHRINHESVWYTHLHIHTFVQILLCCLGIRSSVLKWCCRIS